MKPDPKDGREAAETVRKRLAALADPEHAAVLQRFFKTGPGQYGEGDRFYGIRVPALRKLAAAHRDLPMEAVLGLLDSPMHEERLLSLFLLVSRFQQGGERERERIFRLYLNNTGRINNWDLVDSSAGPIVGAWLWNRGAGALFELARSGNLWERRISIMATFHFIRQGRFSETLQIAAMLLDDPEDLIHKAAGWMLREVGKRDRETEERFLRRHHRKMPRTMLRYAIERFPEELRKQYLKGEI